MIQRIQSLFLIIAAIMGILMFFLPLYTLIPGETTFDAAVYTFKLTGIISLNGPVEVLFYRPNSLLFVLSAVILAIVVAIFTFRNRKQQMRVCKSINFLLLAFIAFLLNETRHLRSVVGPGHALHFTWAAALPFCMIILVILAHRAIRKDEELVRSADRLR